jgi:hypothetical protein
LSAVVCLMGLPLRNYFTNYMPVPCKHIGVHPKKPFKPIQNYIETRFREGDAVAHTIVSTKAPLSLYYWGKAPSDHYFLVLPSALDDYWKLMAHDYSQHGYEDFVDLSDSNHVKKLRGFQRIWLITSSWQRNGLLDGNSFAVKEWMDKNYDKVSEQEIAGVFINLYNARPL